MSRDNSVSLRTSRFNNSSVDDRSRRLLRAVGATEVGVAVQSARRDAAERGICARKHLSRFFLAINSPTNLDSALFSTAPLARLRRESFVNNRDAMFDCRRYEKAPERWRKIERAMRKPNRAGKKRSVASVNEGVFKGLLLDAASL